MYPFISYDYIKKIDFARIFKNPAKREIFKPIYMSQGALKKSGFPILPFFQKPEWNCYPTVLRFPPEAAVAKERQVQKLNYDNFIHVMAEVIQKYAPEILE